MDQPAAGDAGGAVGCAYAGWHLFLDQPRTAIFDKTDKNGGHGHEIYKS